MSVLPAEISKEEVLSYLRPLYPNGIFPLAVGWVIVFWVAAGFVLAGVLFYYSPRRRRRRKAFAVLNGLRRSFAKGRDVGVLAAGVSVLMRRIALVRFGREKTAGLNGREWTDFLDQTGADLDAQDKQLLEMQAYAPPGSDSQVGPGSHLLASTKRWMERNL